MNKLVKYNKKTLNNMIVIYCVFYEELYCNIFCPKFCKAINLQLHSPISYIYGFSKKYCGIRYNTHKID
jgi:hypothetical protein